MAEPTTEMGLPFQPAARLRVVGLLGEIFSIALANLPVLLTLSFLTGLPLMLAASPWGRSSYEQYLGLQLLGYTTWVLRAGFALHLVVAALEGRRVRLAKSLQVGTEEAFSAIRVAAALGVMSWSVFVALVLPATVLARGHGEVLLGARLLVALVGLWLASVLGVSVPVAIQEKTTALESLRRSARLTRGHRWPLFLLFAVFTALDLGVANLLAFTLASPFAVAFLHDVVLVVVGALGAPAMPVVYFHLRRDQESRSVEALAAVFD